MEIDENNDDKLKEIDKRFHLDFELLEQIQETSEQLEQKVQQLSEHMFRAYTTLRYEAMSTK